ncbi:DUF3488 and transglutaminase-like domain-containing protein [Undibacterium cyanobacteriorum]|uniref:DUF3488 and transglutaminase-like domain-containing protein n=1 Tax=Undibacterium cyanobacteriorum TaxID=3073561 RepID=A0ABY9RH04_9BURK|nr:DUF3488 and transglutaminase-like domain-containing protein [Undibacterium sp. 20NA77.5]WMW79376.1 DUF3488 and transglutaminase-like domain-containing protein [Undibacterium sp. 20NA77.5]
MSREKTDTLFLVGACLLVISNHFSSALPWITLSSCSLMLARAWLTFSGRALPRNLILVPIALLLMGGIFYSYRSFFGREAGVAMLILLLACKMLEMHARRDLFVVVFLGFFLILTSFFDSQSLLSALQVSVSALALLMAQLSYQFHTRTMPPLKRLRMVGKIVGLSIPLTIACFFLFPRLQGPLWGLPSDANVARTGLSNSMSPGNISKLAMSEELVFRVRFFDVVPEKSKMYWRANVLDEFDGRTWTAGYSPELNKKPNRDAIQVSGKAIRHEVTIEPNGERNIFALELPNSLPQIEGNTSSLTPNAELVTSLPLQQRTRYLVTSYVDYRFESSISPASVRLNTSILRRFNPKTAEFAAQLKSQFARPQDQIRAMLNYFRSENFYYTLEPPALGRNTVDEFLFNTRSGFCEHYASSFVLVMRYLNIPARVVTGYQGGNMNTQDGYLEVRQSDAHAWAEVWLSELGWVRVDPTAAVAPDRVLKNLSATQKPGTIADLVGNVMGGNTLVNELRMRWSALNNAWNQWVLNYNETKQNGLLENLGLRDLDWTKVLTRLFLVGALILGLTALPLLRRRERRVLIDRLYSRLLDKCSRKGIAKHSHEGPRNFLLRLQATMPTTISVPQLQAIEQFIELYIASKYGRSTPAEHIAQLRRLLKQIK